MCLRKERNHKIEKIKRNHMIVVRPGRTQMTENFGGGGDGDGGKNNSC